jgi:hypothetical protein
MIGRIDLSIGEAVRTGRELFVNGCLETVYEFAKRAVRVLENVYEHRRRTVRQGLLEAVTEHRLITNRSCKQREKIDAEWVLQERLTEFGGTTEHLLQKFAEFIKEELLGKLSGQDYEKLLTSMDKAVKRWEEYDQVYKECTEKWRGRFMGPEPTRWYDGDVIHSVAMWRLDVGCMLRGAVEVLRGNGTNVEKLWTDFCLASMRE